MSNAITVDCGKNSLYGLLMIKKIVEEVSQLSTLEVRLSVGVRKILHPALYKFRDDLWRKNKKILHLEVSSEKGRSGRVTLFVQPYCAWSYSI